MSINIPLTTDRAPPQHWDWPLQQRDGVVRVLNTEYRFEVGLECYCFSPSEIQVTVTGHDVVIHCVHNERSDNYGSVRREIFRAYRLPDDVDPTRVTSHLGNDGVLMISASKR